MYSVAAYHANVNAAAALVNVTPVADPHIRVIGNFFYVPSQLPNLLGASAFGVTPVRAQLRSPSIRAIFHQELQPMGGAVIPSTPHVWMDRMENPIKLDGTEPLEALIMAGAAAQHNSVIILLGDGPVAPVKGDIRTIEALAAIAAVADTWTNVALTFQDTLPSGRYQMVGLKAMSTTMMAARALIPGQYARPGVLGTQVPSDLELERFRKGNPGIMGEFMHDNPPTLDILCNAADAAAVQFYWLDVIYLGK